MSAWAWPFLATRFVKSVSASAAEPDTDKKKKSASSAKKKRKGKRTASEGSDESDDAENVPPRRADDPQHGDDLFDLRARQLLRPTSRGV